MFHFSYAELGHLERGGGDQLIDSPDFFMKEQAIFFPNHCATWPNYCATWPNHCGIKSSLPKINPWQTTILESRFNLPYLKKFSVFCSQNNQYNDLSEFHDDMMLVRGNCHLYNPPGHEARKDCEEVFQFYTAEYGKVLDRMQKVIEIIIHFLFNLYRHTCVVCLY